MEKLVEQIKDHEGFDGYPYDDSKGIPTIGYGTKLPITEAEAELLLKHRLDEKLAGLQNNETYQNLPDDAKEIIANMGYQMGVAGVLGFPAMWRALAAGDFEEAAMEMLDSKWAREDSPARAEELADRMRMIT